MKSLYRFVLLTILFVGSTNVFAQVPVYSSYPSATAVIFLDFDGHTVNGTGWNSNGPIVCAPANLKTAQITEIYNRIAEDYRPFDLNITTDSAKYWNAPSKQRMRVIFTVTNEWYGTGAGGVAWTGSFTWGDNTPCFIFTKLLSYSAKKIAEAGAHEAGHTLGLRHQASYDANCKLTSSYNYGVGTGEISWAPIMGVGYSRNFTTWHNGPNPYGCVNQQSDLQIITDGRNGFGFRNDDHEEMFNAAAGISFSNDASYVEGMITTDTDKDMFKVSLNTGARLKLNALPTSVGAGASGSNLDLMVQLYDASQNLVQTYNPEKALSVSFDTTLNAGTYYMLVDATGNQYASDYGSLGSYSLMAEQIPLVILPVHKLEMNGKSENGYHKLSWNVEADEKIESQILEVSANGKDFSALATNMDATTRSHSYHAEVAGTFFYRLRVTFDNGKDYYTNIIALRSNGNAGKPKLVSNLIRNNTIAVNSPSAYNYVINDFNGKTISRGQVAEGNSIIHTNHISSGTYLIRFTNGSDEYVEKFLKQ
jgi:hypothetical protein